MNTIIKPWRSWKVQSTFTNVQRHPFNGSEYLTGVAGTKYGHVRIYAQEWPKKGWCLNLDIIFNGRMYYRTIEKLKANPTDRTIAIYAVKFAKQVSTEKGTD